MTRNTEAITDSQPKKTKKTSSLKDENGNEIPVKYLDPVVVERDKLVEEMIKKVEKKEAELKEFKKECFGKIEAYLNKTAAKYNEKWQGNASLMNFSKTKQVSLKINKILIFDERLNMAKAKIDEFLKSKTENADDDIKTLVLRAFAVDKKGNVDFKQIVSLKQFKFKNPLWEEAIAIIDEAMDVVGSREYIQFATRKDARKDWQSLILNFASIDTEE